MGNTCFKANRVRIVNSRQRAPWRREELVRAQKRERRRAERKWRKSKLQVHDDIYKEKLCVQPHFA